MKRQFLLLAQTLDTLDLEKANLQGWFMSEKMDGLRVFYDGGVSRGLPIKEVPFANTQKDDRYIDPNYLATGLWSRNAKVIQAPNWFLDQLPSIPLDGEVWGGHGKWEVTSSIVKQIRPNEDHWRQIKYLVFDSPPLTSVFADGRIETDIYTMSFDKGTRDWIINRANKLGVPVDGLEYKEFEFMLGCLKKRYIENDYIKILEQTRLGKDYVDVINNQMEKVIKNKGEGLIFRAPNSYWTPERSYNLLKLKPWYDDTATILYYVWGKQTTKGSKFLGKMGTLGVEWNGKVFEVSGFNDSERIILKQDRTTAYDIGRTQSGLKIEAGLYNPVFPIGSKITFRYRDLSAIGIPKNANFMRKAIDL